MSVVDIYMRIARAAAMGRGVRLSASETATIMREDEAIQRTIDAELQWRELERRGVCPVCEGCATLGDSLLECRRCGGSGKA